MLDIEAQAERTLALLSLAYRQPIPEAVFATLRKAAALWNGGDYVLANLVLTHLGLAEIDAGDAVWGVLRKWERAFDGGLIEKGQALALIKRGYDPDEPRDARGRWTTGGGSAAQPQLQPGYQYASYSSDDEDEDDTNSADDNEDTDNSDQISTPGVIPASYVPGQSDVDTSESQYSPDKEGYHNYTTKNLVCSAEQQCTIGQMADYLSRYAFPGQNPGDPVYNKDIVTVYVPGTDINVGQVETYISNGGLTITNVTLGLDVMNMTLPDHIFYKGQVVRTAAQEPDGSWWITTHGVGNDVFPEMGRENQKNGPGIFTIIDRAMARNIAIDQGLR